MELPAVITSCDAYQDMAEDVRAAFLRRLENVYHLGTSLSNGERRNGYPDFFQVVENLELDTSQLQEFDLPQGPALTRWFTHYSWTFDTTPNEMRSCLSDRIANLINTAEPSTDAPLAATDRWLVELGHGLVSTVDGISNATDYGSAMAHQIALDILLNKVLAACYKLRLNALVPR